MLLSRIGHCQFRLQGARSFAVGDESFKRSVRFFCNFCSALNYKHSYLSFKCAIHLGNQPFQRGDFFKFP